MDDKKPTASEVILKLFDNPDAHFTVSELVKAAGFSRPTVQKTLGHLYSLKKIDRLGFKQREGYIYTPVAHTEFRVLINGKPYSLAELLNYVATGDSPFALVSEDKWRNFMRIFGSLILQGEEGVYDNIAIYQTLNKVRDETVELLRLINLMLSPEISSANSRALIGSDLEKLKRDGFSVVNYINEYISPKKNKAA